MRSILPAIKLLTALLLLLLAVRAKAQTNVSGNQSGTWLKANSPYILTGIVTVPTGQTLTIQPGCKVLIPYPITLVVNGTLIANGSQLDSIYFYGQKQGSYNYGGYISIEASSFNSSFNYVNVDSLGQQYYYWIYAQRSFSLTNSNVRNVGSDYSIGLNSDTIAPIIQNCVFSGNDNSRTIWGRAGTFSNVSNNINAVICPYNSVSQNSQWPNPGTNSYYKLSGDVTVNSGTTLTIQPGCRVLMRFDSYFNVNGTLIANGTASDSIYFGRYYTSSTYPNGGYFNINASSVNSSFSYVSMDSLGNSNYTNYLISAVGSFSCTNSSIRNSGSYSFTLNSDTISPVIQNCTFSGSDNSRTISSNPGSLSNVSSNVNVIIYPNGTTTQNSQWKKQGANSIFRLSGGDIVINSGKTLTIQPGCRVLMRFDSYFNVNGTLIANGTASDSIYFGRYYTSSTYPNGGYFNINASSVNSSFSYVSMDSLGNSNYTNYLISAAGSFTISNSSIKNYGGYGFTISKGNVSVNQCSFSSQGGTYAINITNDTISPTIQNCIFSGSDNSRSIYAKPGSLSNISDNNNVILCIYSGNITQNSQWKKPGLNSFYRLSSGDLTINSGKTLTIQPGCRLLMRYDSYFNVNGTLIAIGTASDSIYFSRQYVTPTYPNGGYFTFNASSSNSSLSYVSMDSLGSNYSSYTISITSSLSITNSNIRNSGSYSINISSDTISPTIQNCTFNGNDNSRTVYGSAGSLSNILSNNNLIIFPYGSVNQDSRWQKVGPNSYFRLGSGNISVNSGKTLTIQPGCRVLMRYDSHFDVSGTLMANGTASDSIYFGRQYITPTYPNGGYFTFNVSSSNSSFNYVSVDSLGSNYSGYLISAASSFSVSNSTIRNYGGYGISISKNGVTVNQCLFSSQSSQYGLYITSDTISPVIQNCTFSGSDNGRSIYANPGSVSNCTNNTNVIISIYNGDVIQNSQWKKLGLNSYYRLPSGYISVSSGKTLTIQPGCRILMRYDSYFDIRGTLIANGTATDSIFFKRQFVTPTYPNGGYFSINASSLNSSFSHVSMDSLGSNYTGYLISAARNFSFTNSSIKNSLATYCITLSSDSISPTVQNCSFSGNDNGRSIYGPARCFSLIKNNINTILRPTGDITSDVLWPKQYSNSYYQIDNTISVNAGYVLTIDSGNVVNLPTSSSSLLINGTLKAHGTQTSPIQFSKLSGSGTNGGSVSLNSGSTNNILSYCSLNKLGTYALTVNTTNAIITNLSVSNSQNYGIYISGASPTLVGANITNNPYGVYVASGKPVLSNCNISNNTTYGVYSASGTTTDTVDARNCFWGDSTGPRHTTLNPSGNGNRVSDKVKFVPWAQQAIRVNQTISLAAVADKYLEDTVKLGATASSGLPVSYSMVTSPATGVAVLSGDTITFLNDTGRVTITATQAGNAYFFPAPVQTISFKVQKHNQSITFSPVAAKTLGDSAFAVRATASSNLPVQFSIVSGPATLSQDSLVNLTGAGTVTIRATQAGNRLYFPATPVQQSFTVYPKLPDFAVQEVASTQVLIAPKDTVALTWKLANVGRAASAISVTERIYIQSPAGANRILVKQSTYTDSSLLDTGQVVVRNTLVAIPAQLIIGDSGVFVVEIFPNATVQEVPGATANNTGIQQVPWAIKKLLAISLSAHQLTEGSSGISVSVSRSGSVAAPLTTTVSFKQPERYTFPANINIPAGQASVSFSITVPNDSLLQATIKDTIEVAATGFTGAKDTLIVLDDDKATLTFANLPALAVEGDTVQFQITTNQAPAAPLTVYLNSNNTARFPVQASVIIPTDSLSAKLIVRLVQNSTPELDAAVNLNAGAAGHNATTATILVKDDDLPNLELVLQTKTVSEGAGQYATQATLRRTAGNNTQAFTANLSASLPNILLLPATVSLAAGESQKTFTIGVVDNTNVDSLRHVIITASVYVASCGCTAPPASAGYVSDTLHVSDNDGPALLLTTVQQTLPEGVANAGVLRITRNTYTTDSLLVYLSSSDTTEATITATAVIPVGQTFVEVPITTVSDTLADGSQNVYLNATATGFAQGTTYIVVTDLTKPDLQISTVTVSSSTVQAKTIFSYQLGIKNTGAATAPAGVPVRGYLSLDNVIDNADSLISEDATTTPIAVGQTVPVLNAVMAPDRPGQYKLLFKVNPASVIVELLTTNNTSLPVNFTIAPDYTATAVVTPAYVLKGTPVTITGLATKTNGTVVINKPVDVLVVSNGLQRKLNATTDSSGHYNVRFEPLANEAGHYTIGAGFPGLVTTATQDTFDIVGVTINGGAIPQFKVALGDTLTGTLPIKNLSNKALSVFTLAPISLPNGAVIRFDTIALLGGNISTSIHYKVSGTALTAGNNYVIATLQAIAMEGVIQPASAFYYCQAPNALLSADIDNINVTVSQSAGQRLVEFRLVNKGRGASGNITINLPQVSWLSSVTPRVMPTINNGDTARVILKFMATADVPFDYPVNGTIGINAQNGNSFTIPFTFKKVSSTTGIVKVTVTNQFTYYVAGAPKVKGALVKIQNYYTGAVYAQGYTDSGGVFTATGVPQGNHRISVEKDRHLPYNGLVAANSGDTVKPSVFINYQAITFSWSVVPTTIQDKYTVTLTSQFEANIPIPVVTVDVPTRMPQLTGSQTYAFNATLTNHGLITAKDVALNLPVNDPEYEFITNYVPADLLAQQSIQVPVLMRRRPNQSSVIGFSGGASVVGVSQFLGISAASAGPSATLVLNCQDFVGVVYWYKCNLTTGLWQRGGVLFTYEGRECTGGIIISCVSCGGGGGGGTTTGPGNTGGTRDSTIYPPCANCPDTSGGGGGIHIPPIFPPHEQEKKNCVQCLNDLASAILGCLGIDVPTPVACLAGTFADKGGLKDYVQCLLEETINGYIDAGLEKLAGRYAPILAQLNCLNDILGAFETCLASTESQGSFTNMTSQNQNANGSGLNNALLEIRDNLRMVETGYRLKLKWEQEYFGNLPSSDAWPRLNVFISNYIENLDTIPYNVQVSALAGIDGYDISASTLQTFFYRWNLSIKARDLNILVPTSAYPNIINWTLVKLYSDSLADVHNYAVNRGFATIDNMNSESKASLNQILNQQQQAVCASVSVQFSQELTMTREAFDGTLKIFNGHPSEAMDSISVNIQITDSLGVPANSLFQIQTTSLDSLANVTGTGSINAQGTGIVKFLFIPTIAAAPQTPKVYNFGGSVTYWDPYIGAMTTFPLASVPITVNPSPNLALHYFMERNILGDDALTSPAIEPSIPAELAVMVENQGYGDARNLSISSAQPEVVDNEKGLSINFELIGSNFQGQPVNYGLNDILFGTIPALQARVGQWYFTSSLLGKFVSYQADVVHENSFGNPNLSLVNSIQLHELTKSIREYGNKDDGINDFLINDIFDITNQPDKIYFSQGNRTADVRLAASGSFSSPVLPPSFSNTLTVAASGLGWNYIKLPDPGNRLYDLVSVTRSDGQFIPLNNAWLTFVTLPVSNAPVYENKFHFVDSFRTTAPVTYSVVWKPRNLDVPKVDSILNLPLHVSVVPVQKLRVVFNKQIDPVSFTYQDMMLRLQGGSNIMDSTIVINQIDTTTFEVDLSTLTTGDGFYSLIVQAAGIKDVYGINGLAGKQATWRQFVNTPAVQAFSGIPASHFASSFDKLNVLFNIPIKDSTLTSQRFSITKNGVLQSGTVSIDSISADHKMVYLSGLNNSINQSGTYLFTVDLFNIQGTNNIFGTQQQSIMLTLDNTAPTITSMVKSDSGRLDILHIPFIKIDFSEDILGFDTAAVQLTRNGQVMRLTPNQLLFITGSKKLAGSFGVLTYPEGNYTFKVNLSKLKDSAGNTGSSIEQISWVVDRTSVIAITGVSITPDLGYSATDGVTAGQLFNVQFNLSDSATKVTVSQFDAAGEVVIRTDSAKAAGIVSVPVSLLTGGNTGIKISATGVNGNSSGIRDTLFIDPIPLTARWKLSNDQTLSILPDTVALTVSAKLLSDTGLFHAISFSKNGTAIVMTGAAITKINDTVYHLTGLRQLSSGAGIYQLSFNKQAISKYSSGRSDSGFVVVSWKLKPINHAPVANAGNDFIVVNPGLVGLNGTASSDPDADPISYRWTSLAGIILNDTTSPMPSFTIAAANRDTTYSFLLVVSDGEAFSTDIVKVSTAFSTCSGADRYFVMPKPGSGYNYQWQIDSTGDGFINLSTNAVHLNVSTDTLRLRQPPTAYSGYKYRCVAIKSATSVTSAVYTLRFSNIWNGNTSTAWENPANWSCGVLPDEHTDVLIKANTTYPLKVGINAACRSLTAQNGATVTISAGYNLDVKGK